MNHINTQLKLQCMDMALKYGDKYAKDAKAATEWAEELFDACLDQYEDARAQAQHLIGYFESNPDQKELLADMIGSLGVIQERIEATQNTEGQA